MSCPLILSPTNNSVLRRNYFKIEVDPNSFIVQDDEFHQTTHFQISRIPGDFSDHNLVYNYFTDKEHELYSSLVVPSFLNEDGLYGIRVKFNNQEWSDCVTINVKAESGWESVLNYIDYTRGQIINQYYGFTSEGFFIFGVNDSKSGMYFKNVQSFNNPDVKKISIVNNEIGNYISFVGIGKDIIKIDTRDYGIKIYKYNFDSSNWETIYIDNGCLYSPTIGYFVNDDELCLIYKPKERLRPSQLEVVKLLFKETGLRVKAKFTHVNDFYDQDIYGLGHIVHLTGNIILMPMFIPKSLDPNDPDKGNFFIKFRVKDECITLFEDIVEDLYSYPDGYYNPVYIPENNRIYWNRKDHQEALTIVWDEATLQQCARYIPHGGPIHLRNDFDGRLYAIGYQDKNNKNIKYLKRFIE